jgi:hypothetical protein
LIVGCAKKVNVSFALALVIRHDVRILLGKMEVVDNEYCFLAARRYVKGEIKAYNAKTVNDASLHST